MLTTLHTRRDVSYVTLYVPAVDADARRVSAAVANAWEKWGYVCRFSPLPTRELTPNSKLEAEVLEALA